jgi:hypothetical protein
MHVNSTHTITEESARDIIAGCSEKTAQDDNTIMGRAAKYCTFGRWAAATDDLVAHDERNPPETGGTKSQVL